MKILDEEFLNIPFDLVHLSDILRIRYDKYGYLNCWGHLPPTESVQEAFEKVLDYIEPKNVLEFGTCLGFSSSYMLQLYYFSKVHSFDIRKQTITKRDGTPLTPGIDKVKERYGERFIFHQEKTSTVKNYYKPDYFDVALVDADHSYENAKEDIQNCIDLKIPYIYVDNVLGIDSVKRAVDSFSDILEVDSVFDYRNIKEKKVDGYTIHQDQLYLLKWK